MKTVKDRYILMGADFAGFPLKEAVAEHLRRKGWKITDVGVTKDSDPDDTENMFHRVGLRIGAKIAEGEYERAYIIPRYVGSYVNLCGVTWDETTYQEIVSDKPSESTCADDGCVIYSALERPEGMAIWYLEAVSPDGRRAGMILSYNGNTGTPPVEYLVPAE